MIGSAGLKLQKSGSAGWKLSGIGPAGLKVAVYGSSCYHRLVPASCRRKLQVPGSIFG